MTYLETMPEYEKDLRGFLNHIMTNKEKLRKFLVIDGFKDGINSTFKTLGLIITTDFDGQERIDRLFAGHSGNYWTADYYEFIYIIDEEMLSFDKIQIIISDDFNEVYYLHIGRAIDDAKVIKDLKKCSEKSEMVARLINSGKIIDALLEGNINDLTGREKGIYDRVLESLHNLKYSTHSIAITKYYVDENNIPQVTRLSTKEGKVFDRLLKNFEEKELVGNAVDDVNKEMFKKKSSNNYSK